MSTKTLFVILAIASLYNFQITNDQSLTSGDLNGDELQNSINADIRAKNKAAADQHQADLDAFFAEIQKDIDERVNKTKTYTVGDFQIRVQDNCEFDMPTPPEPPVDVVEVECKLARVQGHLMAKAVATLSRDSAQNPDSVMALMAECKMVGEKAMFVTFDPYSECLKDQFREYYEVYFNNLKLTMKEKGFAWNEESQHFEKFETETIMGVQQQTEVVPVDGN